MVTTTAPDSSSNFPRKNLTSPWAQVVRGVVDSSSEPLNNHSQPPPPSVSSSSSLDSANLVAAITAAAAAFVDSNNVVSANPKKPAWKNTSNGLVVAPEVSPVMGAFSWPALSAKPSAKLTYDSTSAAADRAGSISVSQVRFS